MAIEFTVPTADGVIAGEEAGEGPTVLLAHGLTATRRYVVMGSRALERGGHRVIAYDARGHGRSSPPLSGDYAYARLAQDMGEVLDGRGVDRAVIAGVSMGAHTALRFALHHPDRVAGVVVITPAFDGAAVDAGGRLARWDALSGGLRSGGIDGFIAAYDFSAVAPALRDTVATVIRQRLGQHADLAAIADALTRVPRSAPFGGIDDLGAIRCPVTVIASGDGADPEHPQRVGEAYIAAIPGARLVLDEPGRSPRAWQGSQVSREIAAVARKAAGN